MNDFQSVKDFWFGTLDDDELALPEKSKVWWLSTPAFDDQIQEKFGLLTREIIAGAHQSWVETPESAVSYIIALDQFCRNMFRGQAEAFSGDKLALEAALKNLSKASLLPVSQRFFLYMPLMHCENLQVHEQLLQKIDHEIAGSSISVVKSFWSSGKKSAIEHYNIIQEFGRYPHRNKSLGRDSTKQEQEYLSRNESSFGQ